MGKEWKVNEGDSPSYQPSHFRRLERKVDFLFPNPFPSPSSVSDRDEERRDGECDVWEEALTFYRFHHHTSPPLKLPKGRLRLQHLYILVLYV